MDTRDHRKQLAHSVAVGKGHQSAQDKPNKKKGGKKAADEEAE